MGFSPESYTFMTMGRPHRADSLAKPGVVSDWWRVLGEAIKTNKKSKQ